MHLASIAVCLAFLVAVHGSTPNVLFIAVDDLRPEINAYGLTHMYTPNIDRLAKEGVLFKRNYVQQAVCSPSRTSLLSGLYPDSSHVFDLYTYFRSVGANVTTLPEHFKNHGYTVAGQGKIFHPGHASGAGVYGEGDDPPSWNVPYFHAPSAKTAPWSVADNCSWMAYDGAPEHEFPDAQIVTHAIDQLSQYGASDRPFFIAAGLHKPHLPFISPSKYFEYYPQADIHIANDSNPPVGMPSIAWSNWGELRNYADIKALHLKNGIENDMPDHTARDLRRAYFAAVSFTDHQVGRLLDALDELNLTQNTTVIFWGDHGWQLGEHAEWCKHTNFEVAARAPLILRSPEFPALRGTELNQLVGHIDIYPTLADLAGLPIPAHCQGKSLKPLLDNPKAQWSEYSFSQYPRQNSAGSHKSQSYPHAMGFSVRSDRWRFTNWVKFDNVTYTPDWSTVLGQELYDHQGDDGTAPWKYENENVVNRTEYASVVHTLTQALKNGPF